MNQVQRYGQDVCRLLGRVDARVEEALSVVDRADFVDGFFVRRGGGWSWVAADARPLPQEAAEVVYSNTALVTAIGLNGMPRSSSSQPALVAGMLDWLQLGEGMRVLEIGTGTGYNAALLSRIVGEGGWVTTVDVDVDFVAAATPRIGMATAKPGFGHVEAVCADGAAGWPRNAPYDRIIATAGCSTVPATWWDQLQDDGLVLAPLSHGSTFPVVALRRGERRNEWWGGYAGHANFMVAVGEGLRRHDKFEPVQVPQQVPVLEEDLGTEPERFADLAFFLCCEIPGARLLSLTAASLDSQVFAGPGWPSREAAGATLLCGPKVYSAADPEGLVRVREATERWIDFGRPRLDRYRLSLGDTIAEPSSGMVRSWTTTRGTPMQTIHLVAGDVHNGGS